MLCNSCGNENRDEAKFCDRCGEALILSDPEAIEYNCFTAWAGQTEGPFNFTYARGFETAEALLEQVSEYGANKGILAYIGGYRRNVVATEMKLEVVSWRRILIDGSLGEEEGPKTITWTNLE